MEKEQWYTNKELFEKIEKLSVDISGLRIEMKETKTLIRDYNGLRENINEVNERMRAVEKRMDTNTSNRKEYIGYIIAAISTLFLLLNYLK